MIQQVIDRLKAQVPSLRLVEGAAELAAIKSVTQSPSAWVLPLAEDAGENRLVNAVAQRITSRFGVVIAVRKVSDARGKAAVVDIETERDNVRTALVGWEPTASHDEVQLARGRLMALTNGVAWWQEEFTTRSDIRVT